jgi:hypothetical protein
VSLQRLRNAWVIFKQYLSVMIIAMVMSDGVFVINGGAARYPVFLIVFSVITVILFAASSYRDTYKDDWDHLWGM